MKHALATVAGLTLVALAAAPALAGDEKAKTRDTQQLPASGGTSVTAEPKTDVSPNINTGASTQAQPSVTTDSPSASPASPSSATDVNPSKPSAAPSASPRDTSEESKDQK